MMQMTPNLACNFKDMPMLDRLALIADMGFTGADIFGTDDIDLKAFSAALQKHKVTIGMVVGHSLQNGLNNPENHDEIEKNVAKMARDAEEIGALYVTVLSGNALPKVPANKQNQSIVKGLKRLIPIAEKHNVTLILEMLNSLYDHPGYYLDDTELMISLVRQVAHPRVKALYDIYHAGVMRGNILEDIRSGIDAIGHFHIAGIPGRHEPKCGEQNYPFLWEEIKKLGYSGHVCCEYMPLKDPAESLAETRNWMTGE